MKGAEGAEGGAARLLGLYLELQLLLHLFALLRPLLIRLQMVQVAGGRRRSRVRVNSAYCKVLYYSALQR